MRKLQLALLPLFSIVGLALIFRIWFLVDYQQGKPHRALGAIPFLFEPGNIAFSIVNGHGFGSPFRVETGPTAWMTPVYPLVLAAIFRIFGSYTFAAFLASASLNILCSALTCIPIWLTGKQLAGPLAGTVAAALWAVFPNAIMIPVEAMWDTSIATLLAAIILWQTVELSMCSSLRRWCAYGLLWGLALMTNATLLAIFPLLLGWLAYQRRHSKDWRPGVLSAIAIAMLCCVPWTIRNALTFHAFIPLRSALGLQLWVGNNEHAQDRSPGALHPIGNSEERSRYIAVGEIEYMRQKKQAALAFMFSHSALELRMTSSRFVAIWTGGTPHPWSDFVRVPSVRFRFVLLFNLIAAIGALIGGAVLFRKRSACAFPVAIFPLVLPLAYYLTLTSPRYRLPVDPAVLLLFTAALLHRKIESSWTPLPTQ